MRKMKAWLISLLACISVCALAFGSASCDEAQNASSESSFSSGDISESVEEGSSESSLEISSDEQGSSEEQSPNEEQNESSEKSESPYISESTGDTSDSESGESSDEDSHESSDGSSDESENDGYLFKVVYADGTPVDSSYAVQLRTDDYCCMPVPVGENGYVWCNNDTAYISGAGIYEIHVYVYSSGEWVEFVGPTQTPAEYPTEAIVLTLVEDDRDTTTGSEDLNGDWDYIYRVAVENPTGFGLKGVSVSLYDGETVAASATTNAAGYAYFKKDSGLSRLANYSVVIDEMPAGYTYLNEGETYKTMKEPETTVTVPLMPTGVMQGELPAGQIYELGDVMYDFTATTSDGASFTLSEVLKEKELVVINFWAAWCLPCISEFPTLQNALIAYQDNVDCIAISTNDGKDAVESFKKQNDYGFNMASMGEGDHLDKKFGVTAIPHTIMVDRYGVVVVNTLGAMVNFSDWTNKFEVFIGEDYVPTVWTEDIIIEDPAAPPMEDESFEYPTVEAVENALDTDGTFSFRWQPKDWGDTNNYPWEICQEINVEEGNSDTGKTYLSATNTGVASSYAILYADFTAQAGDVLAFDYKVGSEENCDILYVFIDDVAVKQISGDHTDKWYTCYACVFTEDEVGEHEIAIAYSKDENYDSYGDMAYIDNLRLETLGDGIAESDDALVFRYAATVPNTDEGAMTQFKNYADIVLSEEDNYYHVGSADGPILFAYLTDYVTPWAAVDIWSLAYNDYCIVDGVNYKSEIEQFAWEATNNIHTPFSVQGTTPVTYELAELLKTVTKIDYQGLENFDGPWHENEWLELCCYFEPYGETKALSDPMKGITYNAAIEVFEGDNEVNVPFALTPRGFKYKFIPEISGAYKVYSTGEYDTIAWLVAGDRETYLGMFDVKEERGANEYGESGNLIDGNFEFYWGFEAGKTYYLLLTTFLDQTATYNVTIEYLGETYTYMEAAATTPYEQDPTTGEITLSSAIDYAYDENYVYDEAAHAKDPTQGIGCYRHVDENGNMAGLIYLDLWYPTWAVPEKSLYEIAKKDMDENVSVTNRVLYVGGVDYTETIVQYGLRASINSGMYYGLTVVTEEIYDFLYELTVGENESIETAWLLLCYYEKTVGVSA